MKLLFSEVFRVFFSRNFLLNEYFSNASIFHSHWVDFSEKSCALSIRTQLWLIKHEMDFMTRILTDFNVAVETPVIEIHEAITRAGSFTS